MVYWICSIKTT